jgi:hypothetical protein
MQHHVCCRRRPKLRCRTPFVFKAIILRTRNVDEPEKNSLMLRGREREREREKERKKKRETESERERERERGFEGDNMGSKAKLFKQYLGY